MAEVNVKALRDFQKMWGPVLDTIPSVIDAVGVAKDIDRAVALRKKELADIEAEIEAKVSAANKELDNIKAQVQASEAQKSKVDAEISQAVADEKNAIKDATKRAKDALSGVLSKLEESQSRLDNISAEIASNMKAAKAEQDAMVQQKQSEISDLERKRVSAERALESLRAKLG